ncbi:MAG TPA: cytochrome c biogenesis protein ResB [Verrucomicrobiae bacterium]|nr:cytochrome c biogenesis protein ResB [Verrucomicrobiae bacterium]
MRVSRLIKIFTSLRLTVTLLAFAIVLVFIGTLAQVDEGLYGAQARYFRQWFIFGIDLFGKKIPLPLPGGYLIGTLMLINLLAAHIYRFQLSVKKIGIQLAHSGVILLLVGQLITDMLAHESQMRLEEGETKAYAEDSRHCELVFINDGTVTAIPQKLLVPGDVVKIDSLPFSFRVKSFWKNSEPAFRAPMMQNAPPLTTNGVAVNFDFHPVAETKTMDDPNVPTAVIEIIGPNGSLGDWVVSNWGTDAVMVQSVGTTYARMSPQMAQKIIGELTAPQSMEAGGKPFTLALRPERTYFPFSLTLLKATHTVYEGTDIPKDFRSRVRLQNPAKHEDREVDIFMNAPLRYAGLTFYQLQMDAGEATQQAGRIPNSVLQIVRNPGWLTPYLGCGMVAAGLAVQFLFHLIGFITKRKTK